MKKIIAYNIYYTEGIGRRYLVATTNNLNKWLEYNNSTRDEEEYETLDMFEVEESVVLIFNE